MKYVVVKEQLWFSKLAVGNSKNKVWISKIYLKKKKEIWHSPVTKPLIPTENSKTNWQHTNATKTSITQRLWTDLELSVGVTTVIQLLWLYRCTVPNLPSNRKSRRTHNFMSKINSNLILYNSKINLRFQRIFMNDKK